MDKKFYISTAIAYASSKPHIGNTYEIVLADVIARYKRLCGYDVYFQTGTDEHGQKIETKAKEANVSPQEYVDEKSGLIKEIWDVMNTSYDKFVRTTDNEHKKKVQEIFKKLYDQGDIYLGNYTGLYCTPCESFWTESQLVDGKCPDCGREVSVESEEAYFFKMSKYSKWLEDYIESHPDFIEPESRKNEIMNNLVPEVLYNDVPILINGNLIGNYNINDLAVNYYLDSNNNIKYKVTTLYGDILYSEDNLDYSCSWLPFRSFIKYNCFNTNSVELSNLLNDNYIKDYILNHGSIYDKDNMIYDSFIYNKANDKLSYFPRYTLKVIDKDNQEHKFDFNNIKLINYCDDKIFALELSYELKNTSLIKVFEYYNLIIDNVYEYSYLDSEIHEIVNNYINEFHKGISNQR